MKNAAQQYIDLFHQNRALIDSHSAPVLNSRREEAMRDFEHLGLPGKSLSRRLSAAPFPTSKAGPTSSPEISSWEVATRHCPKV